MPSEFRPHAAKNPRSSGASPRSGPLSAVNDSRAAEEGLDAGLVQTREPVHRVGRGTRPSGPSPAAGPRTRGPAGSRRATTAPPPARTGRRGPRRPPRGSSRSGRGPRRPGRSGCAHVERLGDQVVVLGRLQRHARRRRARRPGGPTCPAAFTTVSHSIVAPVGLDAGDAAAGLRDAGDGHALEDRRALHARALRVGLRDVGGVRAALVGHPRRREDVVDLRLGPVPRHLLRAHHLDRDPVALREQRLARDGLEALRRAGEVQVPDGAEARVLPGLLRRASGSSSVV